MKLLTYKRIPCWYELSWKGRNGRPGLLLRIHSDFAAQFKPLTVDMPGIQGYMKDFGFKDFSGKLGENFGFENSLRYLGIKESFLEYAIPIPRFFKPTGKPCEDCRGTGKRDLFEDKCLYCNGTGKGTYYDHREMFAVSASLTVIFSILEFPEIETGSPLPQLMTVNTVTLKRSHGGSLGGKYSRELVAYLKARRQGTIPEMVEAMKTAWRRSEGRLRKFDSHYFQAYTQCDNGWLNVSCPGDACGLHPSSPLSENESGMGYEFSCHNVDIARQQLVLLVSLAALHDLARAAGA